MNTYSSSVPTSNIPTGDPVTMEKLEKLDAMLDDPECMDRLLDLLRGYAREFAIEEAAAMYHRTEEAK